MGNKLKWKLPSDLFGNFNYSTVEELLHTVQNFVPLNHCTSKSEKKLGHNEQIIKFIIMNCEHNKTIDSIDSDSSKFGLNIRFIFWGSSTSIEYGRTSVKVMIYFLEPNASANTLLCNTEFTSRRLNSNRLLGCCFNSFKLKLFIFASLNLRCLTIFRSLARKTADRFSNLSQSFEFAQL